MPVDPDIPPFNTAAMEVNEAFLIMLECLNSALSKMKNKHLDSQTAVRAAMQMTMQIFAGLIGDDEEAIRQIRAFVDGWERDFLVAKGRV